MDPVKLFYCFVSGEVLAGWWFMAQAAPAVPNGPHMPALDPGWAAFLRDGGAVAAVLFTTTAFTGVLVWLIWQQSKTLAERDTAWRKHDDKKDLRDGLREIALQATATELAIASQRIAWAMDKRGTPTDPSKSQMSRENPLHERLEELDKLRKQLQIQADALEEDSKEKN